MSHTFPFTYNGQRSTTLDGKAPTFCLSSNPSKLLKSQPRPRAPSVG